VQELPVLFAQQGAQSDASGMVFLVVYLAFIVLIIAGMWAMFEKAGKPGWASIIPIYNVIVLLEIAGKPVWWILFYFIPCANIIVAILVSIEVAKNFDKGVGFALGLALLPFIFYPILGFSDARYRAPSL